MAAKLEHRSLIKAYEGRAVPREHKMAVRTADWEATLGSANAKGQGRPATAKACTSQWQA